MTRIITNSLAVVGFYIALAAGAGEPIQCADGICEYTPHYLVLFVIILLSILMIRVPPRLAKFSFVVLLLICLPLVGSLLFSDKIDFVVSKLWGVGIASYAGICFYGSLVIRSGEHTFAKLFVKFLLLVLVATILYKLRLGFFDRSVRFLFNGPIVFGWWMGFGAIVSLTDYLHYKTKISLLSFPIFLLALFWTQSKGPMVAVFICAFLAIIFAGKVSRKQIFWIIIFTLSIVVMFAYYTGINFENSRINIFAYLFLSGGDVGTAGSVGIRYLMYSETIGLIGNHLFFGIGAGNFSDYFPGFGYPHNVHYEILLEWGAVAFLVYIFMIMQSVRLAAPMNRLLIIYFFVCLSFSGDASYLRYFIPFLILALQQNYTGTRTNRLFTHRE